MERRWPVGRIPELGMIGYPEWFHHHGTKMQVEKLDKDNHTLIIAGSAAHINMSPMFNADRINKGWYVDWEVVHSGDTKVNGRTFMTKEDLSAAFGLSDGSGRFGDWLIERFGADSANQHEYIRWGNFLNIPCPGTGHDGDPNVSIYLDDEIKEAVKGLLKDAPLPNKI